MSHTPSCLVDDCERQGTRRQMCNMHYKRYMKTGNPLGFVEQKRGTHGMFGTPEYATWRNMINRCKYPSHPSYSNYAERGITVCERWLIFENFYADMGEKPEGLTLDRIDNEGNYEPGNCRWATPLQQTHNRRKLKPFSMWRRRQA